MPGGTVSGSMRTHSGPESVTTAHAWMSPARGSGPLTLSASACGTLHGAAITTSSSKSLSAEAICFASNDGVASEFQIRVQMECDLDIAVFTVAQNPSL